VPSNHASESAPAGQLSVWTIGHSRHPWEKFLGLLQAHGIALVADVRSLPRSRFVPHVNRERLEPALAAAGIRYAWLGEGLGGRPKDEGFYDAEGRVRYDRIAASARFREQLEELISLAKTQPVAVLCSEEDPNRCHRRLLLTPALVDRVAGVLHIRGDGTGVAESDLAARGQGGPAGGQDGLFPE
jgi:uncharacterized protein (DUF488 family)